MRQPITLKIKFKSATLDQFIERYSVDVSRGGIFIRTKEPLAVGTQLKFEFQLQDSSSLISGEGTVVWTREHDPNRAGVAPGMGVRFDKLASASGGVLDQILAEKTRRGEAQVESRFDAGVRANAVVSGNIPVKRPSDFEAADSRSGTPLPKPSPGLEGAEEEFGQESTRVMQDDVVQRLAEKTRGQVVADGGFNDEPTRARSAEEISDLVRASGQASSASEEAAKRPSAPVAIVEAAPVVVAPAVAPVRPAVPATVLPLATAAQAADGYREERPPTRTKSSSGPLGLVLGIGVLAVAAVGYFIYSSKAPEPQVVAPVTPAVVPPVAAPVEPAKPEPVPEQVAEVPAGPTVDVTSEPAGATVSVDGTAQPAVTPTKLAGLDPKTPVQVTVALKGYRDWKGKVTPKEGAKVEAKLVPNEKVVEVVSTPSGADVLLDGKKVGRTPFAIHKLDVAAEHKLELRHTGFQPALQSITATDGWEQKGEGKDVLALALTLTAEPPKVKPAPVKHTPVEATPKPASTPAAKLPEPPPTETPTEKPAEPAVEKPAAEKPAAEKPAAEKPAAEKPAEKKEKPADDDRAIKTPAFMKEKPADSTGEGGEAK